MAKFLKGGGSELFWQLVDSDLLTDGYAGYYVQLPFTTESFNPGGEFINSNAIMGSRTRGHGDVGNIVGDGSLDTEISFENLMYVFYAALGKYKAGTVGEEGQFWVWPSNDELPAYDVHINHGGIMWSEYESCKVNSLRMAFESNAVLTASIDMVGMRGDNTAEPADMVRSGIGKNTCLMDDAGYNTLIFPKALKVAGSAIADTIVVTFPEAETTYAGSGGTGGTVGEPVAVNLRDYITALEFTINNNNDVDTNALDAQGRLAIIPGELTVTGSMELLVPVGGGANTVQKELYEQLDKSGVGTPWTQLKIILQSTDVSTDTDHVNIAIVLNNLYLTDINHDVADFGKIPFSIDFTCVQGTISDENDPADNGRPIYIHRTNGINFSGNIIDPKSAYLLS